MNNAGPFTLLLVALCCAASANRGAADVFGSGLNTFDIEFVDIGNPGNAADVTGNPNPAGSVGYVYRIGKYEIAEQLIDEANALGGLGITKDTRGADKPATLVNWYEAARFVNWLNTSTGNTPAYRFALQPGEAGYDANAVNQVWQPSDAGYNPNNLYRNSLAKYVLPNTNEWYKAAYYDPASGVYFNFPTGSDSTPTPVTSGATPGTAVYGQDHFAGPADVTLAGGLSPYGTMGQGGNVYEFEETNFGLVNGPGLAARGVRGGSWLDNSVVLSSSSRHPGANPVSDITNYGFRVASIPEPTSLLLVALAIIGMLRGKRAPR